MLHLLLNKTITKIKKKGGEPPFFEYHQGTKNA